MICNRCIRAALRYRHEGAGAGAGAGTASRVVAQATRRNMSSTFQPAASLSSIQASQPAAPRQGSATSSHNPPAATSTSAAQPFSTPLSSSPKSQDLPIAPAKPSQASITVKSSVPAGTVLKGLNFLKGKQDPVALEDSEYPSWLWDILAEAEAKDAAGSAAAEGDLFCMSTAQSSPDHATPASLVTDLGQRNPRSSEELRPRLYGSNSCSTLKHSPPRSRSTNKPSTCPPVTVHWRAPSTPHAQETLLQSRLGRTGAAKLRRPTSCAPWARPPARTCSHASRVRGENVPFTPFTIAFLSVANIYIPPVIPDQSTFAPQAYASSSL